MKDMEKSNIRHSGLVCDWHQGRGTLFTGGDARVIKVWDAHQEMPIMVKDCLEEEYISTFWIANHFVHVRRISPLNRLDVSQV